MAKVSKRNQNLMQLVKRVHGLVENTDLEKHRQSQDHIGTLLGNTKEIHYKEIEMKIQEKPRISRLFEHNI